LPNLKAGIDSELVKSVCAKAKNYHYKDENSVTKFVKPRNCLLQQKRKMFSACQILAVVALLINSFDIAK